MVVWQVPTHLVFPLGKNEVGLLSVVLSIVCYKYARGEAAVADEECRCGRHSRPGPVTRKL